MKAMVITAFGGYEVFEPREVPKPAPRENQVLVRVHAASVNPVDYKVRQDGTWAGVKPPAIIGYDLAGVVEAIGPGVTHFKPGDEVYYTPPVLGGFSGSYAEYNVADETIVALKPKNLTFAEAACIPLAGCTAWDAVITRARVQPGETILIHAAAGGVGSLAVQIAKAAGTRVIASASGRNLDLVRSLGADAVIDYRHEDFVDAVLRETSGEGVDVVFDIVGRETIAKSIRVTRPHGRIVSIVNAHGDLNAAYLKNITLHFLFMERARQTLDNLRSLIERGQLRPVIDCVMPLYQVAHAHAKLERGGVRGKIVLQVVGNGHVQGDGNGTSFAT